MSAWGGWEFSKIIIRKKTKGVLYSSPRIPVYVLTLVVCLVTLIAIPSFLEKPSPSSPALDRSFFTLAEEANPTSYRITARESLDHKDIHRVFFKIQIHHASSQQDLMAIAQKIVKELIQQEECHSISIDFGTYGHADFAPHGNWNKAGEVPINNYEEYRFKYQLTSSGT